MTPQQRDESQKRTEPEKPDAEGCMPCVCFCAVLQGASVVTESGVSGAGRGEEVAGGAEGTFWDDSHFISDCGGGHTFACLTELVRACANVLVLYRP